MYTVLQVLTVVGIVGGIATGEVGGFAVGRRFLRPRSVRPASAYFVARSARNGGILASIPGLICSIVIGGNFGGSAGAGLVGAAGVPIGIFLGISTILCTAVAAGYVIAGRLGMATAGRRGT
jgi:hypothetical protein